MRGSSNNPLRLVLLGAPGAGKGTQSQLLCSRLAIPHISTGDLLREAQQAGTRLGRIAAEYLGKGNLVPDEVVTAVVEQRLREAGTQTGFALDGFPRTIVQAERLDLILQSRDARLTGVLFYDVPEEELIRRLSVRWVCADCNRIFTLEPGDPAVDKPCPVCGGRIYRRDDDTPEAIRTRFKNYRECTAPLIDYYRDKHLLYRIEAVGQVEEIYLRSLAALHLAA